MKTPLTIAALLTLLTLLTLQARGQIIHVPADQPTIQAGIDAATDGDTVLVEDETYVENINYWGKEITVASHFLMDGDTNHIINTIIDGSQPTNPDNGSVVTFITAEDTLSVLCGFTITGGTGTYFPTDDFRAGGGIACYLATATITHNRIINNECISDNNVAGGGIYCWNESEASRIIIDNNRIIDNECISDNNAVGGGIYCWIESEGNRMIIDNNRIIGNSCYGTNRAAGGGISMASDAKILNNTVENCYVISENDLGQGGGVYTFSSGDENDTVFLCNNTIQNNIATSINAGSMGGGVYSSENHIILKDNIINHDSLSGAQTFGGGISVYFPSYLEMTGNIITHNSVNKVNAYWGAGVFCKRPQGPVTILNNEFSYNVGEHEASGAGGGLSFMDAYDYPIVVDGNLFLENSAYHGGGFYERSSYNLMLTNNLFIGNVTYRGGGIGILHGSPGSTFRPQICNNTFRSNSASNDAGAIRFYGDYHSPPVIMNCIFWDNSAPEWQGKDIFNYTSDTLFVYYCDIDETEIVGPWTGDRNINEDPKFEEGDSLCHLKGQSPCIGEAIDSLEVNGTWYYAPILDYEGDTRPDPVTHTIDMGADEYYAIPEVPVALDPEHECDNFTAKWEKSILAEGYYLDVASDTDFNDILPEYNNLDVGNDSLFYVENLEPGLYYYYRVRAYNGYGTSQNSNTVEVDLCVGFDESKFQVSNFKFQIYPNPSTGITIIKYILTADCQLSTVNLLVYDIMGNHVKSLVNEKQPSGEHTVRFDGAGLPAGIYFVRLMVGRSVETTKLILLNDQ